MTHRLRISRGAITLVEVLLATVLASVVLMALWSLLSIYGKTFEQGHARTEQAQLARTLFDQLTADLEGIRQPAPPPATASSAASSSEAPQPAGASSTGSAASATALPQGSGSRQPAVSTISATRSLRPAGLFGGTAFLQIDVLQPALEDPASELEANRPVAGRMSAEDASRRAAELKTVTYSFEELRDPSRPRTETTMHLVRREVDWADAHPSSRSGVSPISRRGVAVGVAPAPPSGIAPADPEASTVDAARRDTADGQETMHDTPDVSVPEVIQFSLRYFDGAAWSDEWDSVARGGLPLAVEVELQLRGAEELDPYSKEALAKSDVDPDRVLQWKHPVHRLLIPLIAAQRAPASGVTPGSPVSGQALSSGVSSNVAPGL